MPRVNHMPTARTIAVVTGSRAEFGLLLPVMRAIDAHPKLRIQTIVTGLHLSRGTWRDVRDAAIPIDARVPMQKRSAIGWEADVAALARGIAGIGKALANLKPDIVLVLGDRIEAFAAASAATIGGLRVAHLHGGDRAEGVADEAMRHAISKLAHIHFAATAQSRDRLIRMGEPAGSVFNVGSSSADGLLGLTVAQNPSDFIIMQHPIGASDAEESRWMRNTLAATAHIDGAPARRMIFAPNSDPGSRGICDAMRQAKVEVIEHLSRPVFASHLMGARAIVGNSSAGLIEAAILGVPCVNIGPRQNGREKPGNVVDCEYGEKAVRSALAIALQMRRKAIRHPYGDGRTGRRIADTLAKMKWPSGKPRKNNSY